MVGIGGVEPGIGHRLRLGSGHLRLADIHARDAGVDLCAADEAIMVGIGLVEIRLDARIDLRRRLGIGLARGERRRGDEQRQDDECGADHGNSGIHVRNGPVGRRA
ncbi:hypothetical protein WR25_20072 [Diploscapter pachys]|uniref:Uncharacterized protein n=1 Tax=Diploscapter pachys TaxID=2018661 RepID=A0A2A2KE78_9BILA|nr:hypothetical protein WR25_20072 [Diploscapter pachys]